MFYNAPRIVEVNLPKTFVTYEFIPANSITSPDSCKTDKGAGLDWLYDFLKCHPNLSI